jgi:DNA-directed RNA polymerase
MPLGDSTYEALYPSTGVLDAISMISICLRRPDHIPRAYQIFKQLLGSVGSGPKRIPEADVWGKVIQGAQSLAKGSGDEVKRWTRRAEGLVHEWETVNRSRGVPKVAGAAKDGIKVYQGWFAGLVR